MIALSFAQLFKITVQWSFHSRVNLHVHWRVEPSRLVSKHVYHAILSGGRFPVLGDCKVVVVVVVCIIELLGHGWLAVYYVDSLQGRGNLTEQRRGARTGHVQTWHIGPPYTMADWNLDSPVRMDTHTQALCTLQHLCSGVQLTPLHFHQNQNKGGYPTLGRWSV